MPGDATVIKRGKNACCHGDYVGGRAEIIQVVIMVGKEMWCPETRWRKCQRRWGIHCIIPKLPTITVKCNGD